MIYLEDYYITSLGESELKDMSHDYGIVSCQGTRIHDQAPLIIYNSVVKYHHKDLCCYIYLYD